MAPDGNMIDVQNLASGSDAEFLSAGMEQVSDEKLRKIILHFVESTPAKRHLIRCPFRVLNTLSYATYVNLVAGFDRATMLSLLHTERECQRRHEQNFV